MFGVPMCFANPDILADFLFDLTEFLSKARIEGLFRRSGDSSIIKDLKNQLDNGRMIEIEKNDIDDLTSLFKLYFRELPGSLIPPEHQEGLVIAGLVANEEERNKKLKELLVSLPAHHCIILKVVMGMLVKLTEESVVKITKMGPFNFSLVFNMVVIHQPKSRIIDPMSIMKFSQRSQKLVLALIESFDFLFSDLYTNENNKDFFKQELLRVRKETPEPSFPMDSDNKPVPSISETIRSLRTISARLSNDEVGSQLNLLITSLQNQREVEEVEEIEEGEEELEKIRRMLEERNQEFQEKRKVVIAKIKSREEEELENIRRMLEEKNQQFQKEREKVMTTMKKKDDDEELERMREMLVKKSPEFLQKLISMSMKIFKDKLDEKKEVFMPQQQQLQQKQGRGSGVQ